MNAEDFFATNADNPDVYLADRVRLGDGVVLGPSCRKVSIGYGSVIGRDIYIDVEELSIGEYTTIHHGSVLHGLSTSIGHNCWFGQYTIIDSLGGETRIGNNVGVGAHSQLWSHMKFGDVLNGCRWASSGKLILEDDVWLVGHSITGPIHAGEKAMLMTGGVAVRDMEPNHVYSGAPAKDMTDKFGHQFGNPTIEEKTQRFIKLIEQFCETSGYSASLFSIVDRFSERKDITEFNIATRSYRPIRSDAEYDFLRFMLYEKAKWIPVAN